MKKIILLASIVFFLLAPISYHPDTKLTLRYPAFENNKVWDIYKYLYEHNTDLPDFHYPPIHYYWLKIHYPISKFIGGSGFDAWLGSGSAQAGENPNVFRYSFAAKFPLLLLGLLSGYLIYLIVFKYSKDKNKAKMAAIFWYFNPITIYSLVLMGQNDIVAIFLFLAGLCFLEKGWLMVLLWGLASGVKNYPLIWSIIFLLSWEKRIGKMVMKIIGIMAIYGLSIMPWLGKSYFIESVLNSGLSGRMFIANIELGFEKFILIVPLLLVFLAIREFKRKSTMDLGKACWSVFLASLIVLSFSHFNPQWMLWTIPFLSIYISLKGFSYKDIYIYLIVFFAWLALTLGFDDKFLSWGLLNPLNPDLVNYPSPIEFLTRKGVDYQRIINLSQSVLAGTCLYFLFNKRQKEKGVLFDESRLKLVIFYMAWISTLGMIVLSAIVKIDKRYTNDLKNKIFISEAENRYSYDLKKKIKYIEIFLDNPNLDSQDRATIVISDDSGNTYFKEISGYNAKSDSWLRIDIPENMNSEKINVEVKNVKKVDGKLSVALDDKDRLLINYYRRERVGAGEIFNKFISFWWWWLWLILASGFFLWDNRRAALKK